MSILLAFTAAMLFGIGTYLVMQRKLSRIIIGLAAGGLIVFALMSWRARPKLAITDDALVYRGWFKDRRLTVADITRIRITEFRRIGRKVRLLEIDSTDDKLYVLSRWDLGTDPLNVLDALTDAGFAPGPG